MMHRDVSLCNTYNYGDALYWDARYVEEGGASFDWYQRYSALRPFVRKFFPTSSRVLMVGCGNAGIIPFYLLPRLLPLNFLLPKPIPKSDELKRLLAAAVVMVMSEDMVKDGYVDIMNIDISSVVIEMMRKKYAHVPQLTYMQMDVRDMNFFQDESFDCVIDKGTLDSLMCGTDAPLSASQMLEEVNRLLRPGGIYMLITYGDPSVRIPHLNQAGCNWKIMLYIMSRPGFESRVGCSSTKSTMEPVPLTEGGLLPADFVLEDPDSHYIYVCRKMHGLLGGAPQIPYQVGSAIAQ